MKAGKGYLILLTAVFLCAAAVWMSRDAVETVSEKNATESAEELAPRVAITFDDGPHKTYTPLLLDGLKERGVRATFFVVGCQVVKDPDIVQRMAAEGHQVGNHSYDHAALNQLTSRQALEDLEKNDALLRQLSDRMGEDGTVKDTTFSVQEAGFVTLPLSHAWSPVGFVIVLLGVPVMTLPGA